MPTLAILAPVRTDDEAAVVERACAGDRAALRSLLEKYGPALYRSVLLPRLGDEARARDALSETYAKVVTSIGRFRDQGVGIWPWLRTIALHAAIDQMRQRARETPFSEQDLEREVDRANVTESTDLRYIEAQERGRVRLRIEAGLARLNPRYAMAIRLRILEDRPRAEVAKALGASPSTFDVVLHRALASLRRVLQEDSGGDDERG